MLQQGETIHRALLLTAYEYAPYSLALLHPPFSRSFLHSFSPSCPSLLRILLPLPPNLFIFSYKLSQRVELDMEGLCLVEHSSPLPGSSVNFYGELRLRQQGPLRVSPRISLPPILSSNITSVGDVLLPSIPMIPPHLSFCLSLF